VIKLKDILSENVWDRKFGEPLPTLEYRISEEDVNDKKIKFKDADGNDKEATVGGILKKGEDHPAYSDAKAMVDTGKDGEEEEPSGKLGAGDFERDSDTTGGDSDDSWDDEEGRAKPTGKTDADAWEDDEEAKAQAMKDMEDEFDMDEGHGKVITINGKKYKAIK
jgi:hypothetical protein